MVDTEQLPALNRILPDESQLGPKMLALSQGARAFVLAMVEIGGTPQSRAAAMAGYKGTKVVLDVTASRLAADPKVQDAILEEATARMKSSALLAVSEIVKVLENTSATISPSMKLKAAAMVMHIAGMEPAQEIKVTHNIQSTQEKIDEVRRLAEEVGIDPRKLLGKAGYVVDAEFKVVQDKTGLEDVL